MIYRMNHITILQLAVTIVAWTGGGFEISAGTPETMIWLAQSAKNFTESSPLGNGPNWDLRDGWFRAPSIRRIAPWSNHARPPEGKVGGIWHRCPKTAVRISSICMLLPAPVVVCRPIHISNQRECLARSSGASMQSLSLLVQGCCCPQCATHPATVVSTAGFGRDSLHFSTNKAGRPELQRAPLHHLNPNSFNHADGMPDQDPPPPAGPRWTVPARERIRW